MTIRRKPISIHVIDLSVKQDCYPDFERDFGPGPGAVYINAFSDRLPDPGAAGIVVLTGSAYSITKEYPWLPRLEDFTRKRCASGLPLFGVCYGHQLIARALAGKEAVGRATVPEVTFAPIEIVKRHPIFDGLPNPLLAMSSHYDEVKVLPDGFELLARSRDCAVQAMAHRDKPIVGVQFHPEFDIEKSRQSVNDERGKLVDLGIDPDAMLARIPAQRTGSEALLKNFARFASGIAS